MRAARSGDEGAISKLLLKVSPELQRRIEAKIGHPYRSLLDAEDVLQITYIEAMLYLDRFDDHADERAFAAWLLRIAEHNLTDAIRGLEAAKRPSPTQRVRKRTIHESYDSLIVCLGATRTTPSRIAGTCEAIEHLERAIASLPPDYAEAVRAVDIEQRPVRVVAESMGRSCGAIYMLRSRAHDALRESLGSASQLFSFEG